jgi:hypothetical protein
MAYKRKVGEKSLNGPQDDYSEAATTPGKSHEVGWRQWSYHYLLRYFYLLGCLSLDLFVPLGIIMWDGGIWRVVLAIAFLVLVLPLQLYGYWRLWPSRRIYAEE